MVFFRRRWEKSSKGDDYGVKNEGKMMNFKRILKVEKNVKNTYKRKTTKIKWYAM